MFRTKVPRSRGPARTGPRDLEGPVVLPGQDLETLKVPGLENRKSPGTMDSEPASALGSPTVWLLWGNLGVARC